MKVKNLLKTPVSFNLSDGTPIHFGNREVILGLPEELKDDPQIIRRVRRGILRCYPEKTAPAAPKREEPKLETSSKGRKKSSAREPEKTADE